MEPEYSLPHLQVSATCPYPGPDQSSSCPASLFLKIHLNTILPSTPRSYKLSFPQASPPKPCIPFPSPYVQHAPYRSLSSSLCSLLHFSVTSSLLGPNTLLSTLFSNPFSLRYCLSVSDQVPHPYIQHRITFLNVIYPCKGFLSLVYLPSVVPLVL